MCGRFTLRRPGAEVAAHFAVDEPTDLVPRYNAAPGQAVATVRAPAPERRVLEMRHWGLVPGWARDPAVGSRWINARSETAAERRVFGEALRRRRCIVPADGFFEWRAEGGRRQPFHIQVEGGALFGMAGLWEEWRAANGRRIDSCTILTTAANRLVASVHERMPAILEPGDYAAWLDPAEASPALLGALLRPLAAERMDLRPVSLRVNRSDLDDPACLDAPAEDPQQSLF